MSVGDLIGGLYMPGSALILAAMCLAIVVLLVIILIGILLSLYSGEKNHLFSPRYLKKSH